MAADQQRSEAWTLIRGVGSNGHSQEWKTCDCGAGSYERLPDGSIRSLRNPKFRSSFPTLEPQVPSAGSFITLEWGIGNVLWERPEPKQTFWPCSNTQLWTLSSWQRVTLDISRIQSGKDPDELLEPFGIRTIALCSQF
jgi:hypothetical protein